MELHELHILERRAGQISQHHPISGVDNRVGARKEHSTASTGGEDDRLRTDRMEATADQVPGHHASADALLNNQQGDVPFLVHLNSALHELLVHRMQDRVTGPIGSVAGAREPGPTERTLRDTASLISAENHTHPLQLQDIARSFSAHRLNRVLIAEVQTPLRGIERMRLPGVILTECGVDASLCGDGVAADRMHFREDRDVEVRWGSERGSHAG